MALCFAAIADPNAIGGNDEFWQENATTLVWLGVASDRLRDFFLMAAFNRDKQQYGTQYRKEHNTTKVPYSEPFKAAAGNAVSDESLRELAELAEKLQKYRHQRNHRVHDIASVAAERSIELLQVQRHLADKKQIETAGPIFQDEALSSAVDMMKLWFGQLMKATALVFEFEYSDRTK